VSARPSATSRSPYRRDPKDEPYINLAIAAGADYLTSRDKVLLDLMKDPEFTSKYPGIRILDPASLLRELEEEGHRTE
jgi:predicted nucleic acid-binding protein